MKIRRNKIRGLLSFFFHHDHGHFAQPFDGPDKSGNLKGFVLTIQEKGDLSISRIEGGKGSHLGFFTIHPEDGRGFELGNHMVTVLPTTLSQFFRPIPTVHQNIEFARDRKSKGSDDPFGQSDLGLKASTTPRPFRVIELGPKGQEKIFIKQGRKHPLVAKDISHILSMIFVPRASWNLLATLLSNGIINDKKEDRVGFDAQGIKELLQSDLCNLFEGPDVLSQETGETGERAVQEGIGKGLNHRGSVRFFAQLDKASDKRGKNLERRS